MYHKNILSTIGHTPLVQLNKITKDLPATVLAKVESFNPGHSVKDRIGRKMVEVAEAEGKIKPGGTLIECTSGNTGMGIALTAIIKGYRCIFTTSDKQSKEKIDILKAMGAEVIVCPTNVAPKDPRSYYSVAERLSKEIPNSYWVNQYDNLANTQAHFETTGPELWEQTDGKITHFVAGVGTGGTISGTARYLKQKNPDIKIWGIDTYGSVFKKYHETGEFDESEIYPYITEGIGEDLIPENVKFDLIDHFEKVTDKDGAIMARRLSREEGLFVGYSCGSAVAGLLQLGDQLKEGDLVVVLLPDHGSRYVGKIYNDDWMRDRSFLESELTIGELLNRRQNRPLISVKTDTNLSECLRIIKEEDISQLPVIEDGKVIGTVTESHVLSFILEHPESLELDASQIMGDPLPMVELDQSYRQLNHYFSKEVPGVLAKDRSGTFHIITKYDVLQAV